jgi:hypothetical protein
MLKYSIEKKSRLAIDSHKKISYIDKCLKRGPIV